MNRYGFTLLEVLVATAILSIGMTALGALYMNFNNQRRLEILAVNDYVCSVSSMEQVIHTFYPCQGEFILNVTGNANRPCKPMDVKMTPIPGISHLALAILPTSHDEKLQRIVRCK